MRASTHRLAHALTTAMLILGTTTVSAAQKQDVERQRMLWGQVVGRQIEGRIIYGKSGVVGVKIDTVGEKEKIEEKNTFDEERMDAIRRCGIKYKNKRIDTTHLNELYERHQTWLHSHDTHEKRRLISTETKTNSFRADLCGADLSGTVLRESDSKGTKTGGVNLSGAILRGANLAMVNLSNAKLIDTNLHYADLRLANLSSADLRISGSESQGQVLPFAFRQSRGQCT